jgi:hypothetical protein
MHHQLGGSTEDDMNKMSVIGHISLFLILAGLSTQSVLSEILTIPTYVEWIRRASNRVAGCSV